MKCWVPNLKRLLLTLIFLLSLWIVGGWYSEPRGRQDSSNVAQTPVLIYSLILLVRHTAAAHPLRPPLHSSGHFVSIPCSTCSSPPSPSLDLQRTKNLAAPHCRCRYRSVVHLLCPMLTTLLFWNMTPFCPKYLFKCFPTLNYFHSSCLFVSHLFLHVKKWRSTTSEYAPLSKVHYWHISASLKWRSYECRSNRKPNFLKPLQFSCQNLEQEIDWNS